MKDASDITIILDRSGSMSSVRADTIGGFNAFLEEQKAAPGEATLTLVQFNTSIETIYSHVPVASVEPLTERTFVPGGNTALLDAMGMTIDATGARLAALAESERPDKVLLVIMTDGEENSSHCYSREKVFGMISHQREKYSWQIAFIGANQDAISTGASLGIPAANAMNYASTPAGTTAAFRRMSHSASAYRARQGSGTDNFFNADSDASADQSATKGDKTEQQP